MSYSLRHAEMCDGVRLARMLRESLSKGHDGKFTIDNKRLLDHVHQTIRSADGFALVLEHDEEPVGCFMAELQPHAYCHGNIVQELGVYIKEEHRGNRNFVRMFDRFSEWAENMPDVLYTVFTIGQLGATSPFIRKILEKYGFKKGDEGYIRL